MLRGDSKYSRNLLTVPSYRHYLRNTKIPRSNSKRSTESRWQPSCTFFVATVLVVLVVSLMIYLKSTASKYTHHWSWRLSDHYSAKKYNLMQTNMEKWLSKYPHIESHVAYEPFTCDAWKCKATFDVTSEQWIEPRGDYVLSTNNNNYQRYNEWQERHKAQNQQLLDNKPCNWVFIGDSITFRWNNNMNIFNQYFNKQNNAVIYAQSGDKIHEIGWRLKDEEGGFKNMEQCLLDGKKESKSIVLLIGTNDIGSGSTFDIALTDYMVLLHQLSEFITNINKKQSVVLYVTGIFPRGTNWIPMQQRELHADTPTSETWDVDNAYFYAVNFMNEYLRSFADNHNHIKYIDCNDYLFDDKSTEMVQFKDEEGKLHEYRTGVISTDMMEDLLHLSAKGYEQWATCILTETKSK